MTRPPSRTPAVLTESGSICYQVLLGLAPLPPVRKRPLHGNEGPNWRLTPARAAQREAVFARLLEGRRAHARAFCQAREQLILRALAHGPLNTSELARKTGLRRDALNGTYRDRMLTAGQITVTRVPMAHGGPGVYLWAIARPHGGAHA